MLNFISGAFNVLAMLFFITTIAGLIRPRWLADKKTGMVPGRGKILLGGLAGMVLASVIAAAAAPSGAGTDSGAVADAAEAAAVDSGEAADDATGAPSGRLAFSFDEFKGRVNDYVKQNKDLAAMPAGLKPQGGEDVVFQTATHGFRDGLAGVFSVDPKNQQLTSVLLIVAPSKQKGAADMLAMLQQAAAMLALADKDGDAATAKRVLEMTVSAARAFGRNPQEAVSESMTAGGVNYAVNINKLTGFMLSADAARE